MHRRDELPHLDRRGEVTSLLRQEIPTQSRRQARRRELHREDGPAIIHLDGTQEWFQNGELNRKDGPAVEYADGTKYWYKNNKLHREDGAAIEWNDGSVQWFRNGNSHRKNGPANIWNSLYLEPNYSMSTEKDANGDRESEFNLGIGYRF